MITRKTRLTSALLAVLMLMTMLAAYVLPATAAVSSPYPYVRDMETLGRDYADDWGIGSAEDWFAAVELGKAGENFSGKTLHFTADIDFDLDGDGEYDEDEKVDSLGGAAGFYGNIHGHGYVIENLYVDHDVATEGVYGGLIGYAKKSGMVIRDLGIASGKIYVHGALPAGVEESYNGAFVGYSASGVTYANCWNAAEIEVAITGKEADAAPFGRGSGVTLVNCLNRGDINSAGADTNRVSAFVDWTNTATKIYNCVNIGSLNGSQVYFTCYGSSVKEDDHFVTVAGNIVNAYASAVGKSNKSAVTKLLTEKGVQIEKNIYYTGELACMLNDNYDSTYDSLYGRKYYKMENGELVMTDDPYDALYKLTVNKQIGDYVVSSEISYVKATTAFTLPSYEGYVLDSHSDAIMPDYVTNTFRMPPENAELNYISNVPDWNIVKELIDKYDSMVESGHAKALNDTAALTELLDKLKLSYAAKDTMSEEQAMARIALYVKDNANLDLSIKSDLVYPNYPLMRYFDKSVSKIWGIRTLEDWQAAVKLSQKEKESFEGITIHFLDDVDFNNVKVDPLGADSGFAGNIEGHGKAIKNLLIEGIVDENTANAETFALIAKTTGSAQVIRDLGIESGTVKVRGSGDLVEGAVYVGIFNANGSNTVTFVNCWTNADIDVDVEKYEIDAATFGRTTGKVTLINCINTGDISVNVNGGRTARADSTVDWNYGNVKIANVAHTGRFTTLGGTGYNQSYIVGLASSASDVPEGNITNVYGTGVTGISSKSYLNERLAGAQLDPDAINAAELAWKLNRNYDSKYDDTYGKTYYTVKDSKVAFGAASEQPVRVNIKSGDTTMYLYGLPGDTFALNDLFTLGNPSYKVVEAYAASVDANNVLTIQSLPNELEINVNVTFAGGLDYGALAEAIAAYDDVVDMSKYTSPLTTTTLSAKLAEIQAKTYTSQTEIDADVEILGSYFYAASIKEFATNPTEDIYTVATLEDLEYVAKYKGSLGVDQTVMLTANITVPSNYTATIANVNDMDGLVASIDGGGYTLEGLRCITNGWLHEYAGDSIKNITFKDCWTTVKMNTNYSSFLMEYNRADLLIENVTFDNCKDISDDSAGAGNRRSSIVVGNVASGYPLTLKNVTIKNCEMVSRGAGNSAFVVGNISSIGSKVNIDGLYVYDNLYSGPVSSSGCAYLFGENNGTTVVKNAAIFNNSLGVDGETIQGVITGSTKQGKLTLQNIMTYNNEGTNALCGKTTSTSVTYTLVKSGIYSDCTVMTVHPRENRTDNSALILSGEAAALINATNPTQTWAMKNGMPVFSETGLPVKVTLDLLAGNDVVLYTDINGKLFGLSSELASKFWVGYTDLANAVFTEETTVVQADCNHAWDYTNNNNGTHTITFTTPNGCGEVKTVDCDLTYVVIDGVTHTKKCDDCGYNVNENCTKETTHVYGTYGAASKHVEVCTYCEHSTESACDFTEDKVAHTNIAKGYSKYTCDCGYSYKVEETEKAHEFSVSGVLVKAPSYGEAGVSKHKCTICDAYEYREIQALTGTGIIVKTPESTLRGEEITVELLLGNNAGNIAGMNLQVAYDVDVLELKNVVDNGIFDLTVQPDVTTAGEINLTYANAGNVDANETDGKALTTLTFKVLDTSALGSTEITAKFIKSEEPGDTGAVDYDSNFVEVGEGYAVTEIIGHFWGDANNDGDVNVADAQTILQWKVAKDVSINLAAADADRDGEVGIPDALMLLQYVNGLVEWDPNGSTVEPA